MCVIPRFVHWLRWYPPHIIGQVMSETPVRKTCRCQKNRKTFDYDVLRDAGNDFLRSVGFRVSRKEEWMHEWKNENREEARIDLTI